MSSLPHELVVWETLVRLPAKSLLRLRCVCKAWRHTISDANPSFSQAHLRQLHQQDKKLCSLLIAPRIKSDAEVPHNIRRPWVERKIATPGLYLWEESRQGVTTLLQRKPTKDMGLPTATGSCSCPPRIPCACSTQPQVESSSCLGASTALHRAGIWWHKDTKRSASGATITPMPTVERVPRVALGWRCSLSERTATGVRQPHNHCSRF
ncbi:uncharacterized protein [Triticum aestivum]|uniref:uncharacterized protein n=1 Tax=Triticum aestivum TaxID=4565 RepID=UPI001D009BE0|nr:uncharacterized protein LOC123083471 [Triticum aestivum]